MKASGGLTGGWSEAKTRPTSLVRNGWWGRGKGKDWTSSERHRLDCVREGGAVGWTVFPVGENSALLSFLTRLSP